MKKNHFYASNKGAVSNLSSECTTLLVGSQQMVDGSRIAARSEDWDGMIAKNLEVFEDTEHGPRQFKALDSPFQCELPEKAFGYTTLAPFHLPGHWGSAGFNSQGVGMSATESIFSSDKALEADPLVENGLGENCVYNIVLPYITSARNGVEYLGKLIEKHGIAEGFGISFIDEKEVWYLETACGHRWLACKLPDDQYFVSGNQSRFRDYDPKDKEHFLASEDLIEFAKEHKLYNPEKGKFDFHEAYIRDIKLDTTYNYPRVWALQNLLSPSIKNDVTQNTFPIYAQADKKLDLEDVKEVFRFHYNQTSHDPYLNNNPKEEYRPVCIFRTTQTHILQVRPELPKEIGEINYVAFGMAALAPFIPFYQGAKKIDKAFMKGTDKSSEDSAYWKFRKVQTLGMTNYNKYAPIIKERYSKWEKEYAQRQLEMEKQYMEMVEKSPLAAQDLLQEFSNKMMKSVLKVADELKEELFTIITKNIQEEYLFHGA